jgi:RimJ/RimL family protein N-acetyltransferase
MTDLPVTRLPMSAARQEEIRQAVRSAQGIAFADAPSRVAQQTDAPALLRLLQDPEIHGPIYNLPSPLTQASVQDFIAEKAAAQARGDGLLLLRFDAAGEVIGYSEFDIWPEWGAGDLGGALRADQQGRRVGVAGAQQTFSWMFEVLRLELIVATGARDNVRTARMLDGLGFQRRGEVISHRPDGTSRASVVWECVRSDWPHIYQRQF